MRAVLDAAAALVVVLDDGVYVLCDTLSMPFLIRMQCEECPKIFFLSSFNSNKSNGKSTHIHERARARFSSSRECRCLTSHYSKTYFDRRAGARVEIFLELHVLLVVVDGGENARLI